MTAILAAAPPRLPRPAGGLDPVGVGWALAAAAIWGGTLAMTRLGLAAEAAALGPADMVLLRFLAPALLLLPVAWRALPRLRRADLPLLAVLVAGGGPPFVLVASAGLRAAEAADAGALLPGTVPLWVAVASLLAARRRAERPAGRERLGLGLIALAVLLVAGPAALAGADPRGPGLLLAAAWLAAAYTLALRGLRLAPVEAVALVSLASVLGFLPVYLLVLGPGLPAAGWREIALQAAWQGGLSGLVAPIAFAAAVARLGAARAAAFGALSPAAAALSGLLLMREVPEAPVALGLLAAGLGVALLARGRPEAR